MLRHYITRTLTKYWQTQLLLTFQTDKPTTYIYPLIELKLMSETQLYILFYITHTVYKCLD